MQTLTIEVERVALLTGQGTDMVIIHTAAPSPYPGLSKQCLRFDFSVAQGNGYLYLTSVLKIRPELIEIIKV